MKNQDETDVDCGGETCPKCVNKKVCRLALDCVSGICTSGICEAPTCTDDMKNQDETDEDCGGSTCPKCEDTKVCNLGSDCISGVCQSNVCQVPTCTDGVKNQGESDVDCGGAECGKCANGKVCNYNAECFSDECTSNICQKCSFTSFKNGDFESGNSNGWIVGGGIRTKLISSKLQPQDFLPGGSRYNATVAKEHSSIVTSGNDPNLKNLMPKVVHSGKYAWRVEDTTKGGYVSVLSQRIQNYNCLNIYFAWLAVLENGGHDADNSSVMIIELKDETTGDILLSHNYDAGAGSNGIDTRFKAQKSLFYTPSWQIEHLAIDSSRTGHDFTLTVLVADCKPSGHKGYVYIDSFGGIAPQPNMMN